MGGPRQSEVDQWVKGVEKDLTDVDAQLAPLLERQSALAERLGLLKRLQASMGSPNASEPNAKSSSISSAPMRGAGGVRERVVANAAAILEEAGAPMHINELHAEFIRRGFQVPGAGKPNNITVHLAEASGIRTTARGFYTIASPSDKDSAMRYPVIDQSKNRSRVRG